MKVLMINGSPNEKGCTHTALLEVKKTLESDGIETEMAWVGKGAVRDCIACFKCMERDDACIFKDDCVNALIGKIKGADGVVVGSPVHFAHPSGRILSVLNRVFFASAASVFAGKPAAAVVSARRAGTTAALDVLHKYFAFAQMPIVTSTYWNMVHGHTPEEVRQDAEGLQTMRNLGRNMAWMLKSIDAGKKAGIARPKAEDAHETNFIRSSGKRTGRVIEPERKEL